MFFFYGKRENGKRRKQLAVALRHSLRQETRCWKIRSIIKLLEGARLREP